MTCLAEAGYEFNMQVDLCCGSKKRPGSLGVDIAPGPGIDIVHNLDTYPWPLEANSATDVLCEHGVEHVKDVVQFMRECHRILKPGGQITIVTPHFSSHNSYGDPTHLRHLSAFWFRPFMSGGYLASRDLAFELISTEVTFGKSLRSKIAQMIVSFRGLEKWEKNAAFRYPGSDVRTTLKALK